MTYGDRGMARYCKALFTVLLALLLWGGAAREYSLHKELKMCRIAALLLGKPGDLSWNDTNMEGILSCHLFCIVNGFGASVSNVAAVRPREYEASSMAAVLTANITKTGVIGMVAGFPNEGMEHLLDVFEQKAREILKVVYSNEAGIGCIEAAAEKGVKVIGFSSNPTIQYPDTVAASVKFDFGKFRACFRACLVALMKSSRERG